MVRVSRRAQSARGRDRSRARRSHVAQFALGHVRLRGHIEILDASGRRIWGRALAQGSGIVIWDGAKDSGGLATPGIYFARAEDSGGVSTSRMSWLGGR